VFKAVSFKVTWTDVNLILAELRDDLPDALNAPLLSALLAASTRLDLDAARLVGGRYEQTTDLRLPEKHAQPFREWLDRATLRRSAIADHGKAQAFVRLRGSER
jgi:hypothetical protein